MKYRRLGHKFFAKRCVSDGINFPSQLERNCYIELKRLQTEGKLLFFLRQVPFHLPGNTKALLDYMVFLPNEVKLLEAKGRDLPTGKARRKLLQDIYNVEVQVITNPSQIEEALFTKSAL